MRKTKIVSVITILACLFMLIAGALGMSDVMEQKDIKTQEGAEAREQIDTLAAGIEELEANRPAYDEGKQAYTKGLAAYNAGLAKYNASLKEYNEGLRTLNSKTADYENGKVTYANGLEQYNAGLSKYNSSLQQYENGKKALEAGRAEYEEKKQLLAGARQIQEAYNELTSPHTEEEAAAYLAESTGNSQEDILTAYNTVKTLTEGGFDVDTASKMVAAAAGDDPARVKAAYENVQTILACKDNPENAIAFVASSQKTASSCCGVFS